MKLLLIGTGAVGCAVAIAAANAGMETTLLARSGTADYLRAHGLKRTGYRTFWKDAAEYQSVFYGKLVPDTFAHRSSTLQDIENRRRTEIDTLNGCIQRLGRQHGVPTPTHDMIVEMIRGIEDVRCQA